MAAALMRSAVLCRAPMCGAPQEAPRAASSRLPSASHFASFSGLRVNSGPSTSIDFVSACRAQVHAAQGNSTRGVVQMGPMEAGIGLMANKVGMMTWFMDGKALPVTVLGFHAGNIVTQVKSPEKDGYSAVQVGYRRVRDRKLKKPEFGHLEKVGVFPMRHLQEFRLQSCDQYEPGQYLHMEDLFKEGDLVDVSGISIGKGFQGGIKAHNFARGPMSHGSKSHRQLGSIGAGTTPGRVYPGKKMPKRLGNEKVKIRKLTVIKVDSELRAIIIKGSVPGKTGNLLRITPAKIVGKNIPKN